MAVYVFVLLRFGLYDFNTETELSLASCLENICLIKWRKVELFI